MARVVIQKAPNRYRIRKFDDKGKILSEEWVGSLWAALNAAIAVGAKYELAEWNEDLTLKNVENKSKS